MTQPLPQGQGPNITPLVIEDLKGREQRGIETYGESLKAFNGRSALQDAYEEALDLAQYLKQRLIEEASVESPTSREGYLKFLKWFRAEFEAEVDRQDILPPSYTDVVKRYGNKVISRLYNTVEG